ncbi:MAG: DUF6291 domain-containing protein [Endomicrobium sp.]|jgi:hypothetical protein|nr:DUF6291 domain-containing protein [Endomicrobium sp.]
MGTRNSFVFYSSFFEAIKELEDKDKGIISYAIMQYGLTGESPKLTGYLKSMFLLIKPQIDANNERYENGCKGAEYGKLGKDFGKMGGRPKSKKSIDKQRKKELEGKIESPNNPPRSPQLNPNNPPNEDVDVNVNEDVDENEKRERLEKLKAISSPSTGLPAAKSATAVTPTISSAPLGKVGFPKGNGNGFPSPSPKPSFKPSSSAAKLYAAFRTLYGSQTHFPYHARKEDLASMEILVKRHGEHAVENKIRILHSACKNAVFWFTKKGFSEFIVSNLIHHWNELVPFETDEQKQERLSLEKTREVAKKIFEERQKERQKWQSNRSKVPTKS